VPHFLQDSTSLSFFVTLSLSLFLSLYLSFSVFVSLSLSFYVSISVSLSLSRTFRQRSERSIVLASTEYRRRLFSS